ncbi:hypothetical protein [Kitasatospora indigofera]|uniref:hypothetical protein n=1 Tax=Kitasatospora indigofera TaxID=67307 RepID=UPI0033AAA10D
MHRRHAAVVLPHHGHTHGGDGRDPGPAVRPPVAVDGRWYLDGALRAGPNADLAAGARTLVVVEPTARPFPPGEPLDGQLAVVGADTVVTIGPDPPSVRAFGSELGDLAAWEPAYRAGLRQAGDVQARLRAGRRAEADAV